MRNFPLTKLFMIGLAAMLASAASAADPLGMPEQHELESARILAAILASAPVEPGNSARPARPAEAPAPDHQPDHPMRLALTSGHGREQGAGLVVSSSALAGPDAKVSEMALADDYFCKSKGGIRKPPRKPSDFGRETTYRVKPGDQLEISIWKEPDMRREMLVLPDGTISYPLAGHIQVVGMTPKDIEDLLSRRLVRYFKNPFINVIVKRATGNQIYVLGEVRNPGAFTINQPIDVMQALSLAGGLSEFADKGEIIVLRRLANGGQEVLSFKYSSVQRGRNLNANITLLSGDTVVVPERGLF